MKTLTIIAAWIAVIIFTCATVINVHAQASSRNINVSEATSTSSHLDTLSGIYHSSQADVEKIVLTDLRTGSLLCRWYFKNGDKSRYILKKVSTSTGKNAKAVEKSIDFQANENNDANGVYEYTYGKNDRYLGTLFIWNGTIVEVDEDTDKADYYARYEWHK